METKSGFSRRDFLRGSAALAAGLTVAPSTSAKAASGPTNIVYWYWADSPQIGEFFRRTIDNFNKRQTAVHVEGVALPSTAVARAKIVTAAASGAELPDVSFTIQTLISEFYQAGMVRTLDDFYKSWNEKEDLWPAAIESARWIKGERPLMFLPWAVEVGMHYYRADLFKAANQKPPETFDDLIATAKALNKPPEQYGFGLRGADGIGMNYNLIQYMAGHGLVMATPDGKTDLDSPLAEEIATAIARLYWDGVIQPSALQDRMAQMMALLQTGKIAQWSAGTLHGRMIDTGDQMRKAGKFANCTIPVGKAEKRKADPWYVVNGKGNAMMKTTKHPEAAWQWLTELTSTNTVMENGQVGGDVPSRKSVTDLPIYKQDSLVTEAIKVQKSWRANAVWHKHWPEFYGDPGAKEWQQVLMKQKSVKDMLKTFAGWMRDI